MDTAARLCQLVQKLLTAFFFFFFQVQMHSYFLGPLSFSHGLLAG